MDAAVPRVEVVTVEWERIQLVVRIRADDDGATFRLEHDDAALAPMQPTGWSVEDGVLRLRFNVMLGPGQMPLAFGRWALRRAQSNAAQASGPLVAAPIDVDTHREFLFRRGSYAVRPAVDASTGGLVVDVSGERWRSQNPLRRIRSALTRTFGIRTAVFRLLLRWHGATGTRNGRRILFTSDSHAGLAGNLAVVHDRMVERGLDREYEIETLFKASIAAPRPWRDRLRLPRLLARADVILLDDYQPVIYRLEPDPDVRIVQLWHASGAFKTVGYSRIGKRGGPSPYWKRHKNYTHAIVSGQHDVPYYAEAFGIPDERVVPTGIPRMDRFFDEGQRSAGRQKAQAEFPSIVDGRTFLFAPTFRGTGPRNATYDYSLIDWERLYAVCAEKDATMLLKMHPFVREPWPVPPRMRDRLIDATRATTDVNDLLFAVDVLITDYSSIVFEFATLGRPMLFFAYDLEEYVTTRDFYVPFEEFVPGRIARTFDEVLLAMQREDYAAEKVAAFARRHFDHLDGTATDRIIDELIVRR